MQALDSVQAGQHFVEYYRALGYKAIPGSSLLDPSVPMAFVMSAGLAQVETSASLQGGRTENRYTLLQNCFRYFDLDKIGQTDVHLSLFQMPGAFTFGPFSQRDSITQTWALLTEVYGFPPESLWATYFSGGEVRGYSFESDWKTCQAWRKVGMQADHIVGLGEAHNFWKQGASVMGKEQAPKCGANTEVFFDRGAQPGCGPGCQPGCACGRFVEFTNTLFITMHIDEQAGVVKPLENPFTETVIGAERVAMLLQGATSVFEIDSMHPLITHARRFAKSLIIPAVNQAKHERILADHLRALLFLAADGAPPPGRGGRARLMRKLVREMLSSQTLSGISDPAFVPSLVNVALDLYAKQHPQLLAVQDKVLEYITEEKALFERTVQSGYRQLDHILAQHGNGHISGQDVLNLEKSYGVPMPLLKATLKQRQIQFSWQEYQTARGQWRQTLALANQPIETSPIL